MKTILVTGAAGFIGQHTLKWLSSQKGIKLIAACRDRSKLIPEFNGEVREGDIRDDKYLAGLMKGVDVLVNAVAWSSLFRHKKQSAELFYQPNIKLIDQYLASNACRFINMSTTSAAAPKASKDALSYGVPRSFWPHLVNLIKIENYLRQNASTEKTMVNLRMGLFVGEHYGLGILPILLPRLRTHLVPWVKGGKTELPLTDGRDLGQAMGLAALAEGLQCFEGFNIVGKEVPTARDVMLFLHKEFSYPKPHFSVPFWIAYPFAWLMEKLDRIVPWEPLIVRTIVHLLENTYANNDRATAMLGYQPQHHWHDSVRRQIAEMKLYQTSAMSMAKEVK